MFRNELILNPRGGKLVTCVNRLRLPHKQGSSHKKKTRYQSVLTVQHSNPRTRPRTSLEVGVDGGTGEEGAEADGGLLGASRAVAVYANF